MPKCGKKGGTGDKYDVNMLEKSMFRTKNSKKCDSI